MEVRQVSWLDPNWRYVPANSTDLEARFRALGWTPPSEARKQRDAALRASQYLTSLTKQKEPPK